MLKLPCVCKGTEPGGPGGPSQQQAGNIAAILKDLSVHFVTSQRADLESRADEKKKKETQTPVRKLVKKKMQQKNPTWTF